MQPQELTDKAKDVTLSNGADVVGVVAVTDLPEHAANIAKISKHSLAALKSEFTNRPSSIPATPITSADKPPKRPPVY